MIEDFKFLDSEFREILYDEISDRNKQKKSQEQYLDVPKSFKDKMQWHPCKCHFNEDQQHFCEKYGSQRQTYFPM